MKSFRTVSAVYNSFYDLIEVVNETVNDDDTVELGLHTFSPETLEWRAALYDTDDLDELIDMVLLEPFIEDVRPLQKTKEEATRLQRERVSEAKQRLRRNGPFSRVGVADALRSRGVDKKYSDAAEENPYEVIKRHCPFDPTVLEVKREFVAMQRESQRAAHQRPIPEQSRAERLRERLLGSARSGKARTPQQPRKLPESASGEQPPIVLEGKKTR